MRNSRFVETICRLRLDFNTNREALNRRVLREEFYDAPVMSVSEAVCASLIIHGLRAAPRGASAGIFRCFYFVRSRRKKDGESRLILLDLSSVTGN